MVWMLAVECRSETGVDTYVMPSCLRLGTVCQTNVTPTQRNSHIESVKKNSNLITFIESLTESTEKG